MVDTNPATRVVPGAPPSVTQTKPRRKKRKANKTKASDSPAEGSVDLPDATSTTPLEKAPESSEAREILDVIEFASVSEDATNDDVLSRPSPVIGFLQKRMRTLNKKISRIAGYASTDTDKLNEDQRRSIKTLPSLEAVQKELEDIKKAIEVHETEASRRLALKLAESERLQEQKLAQAISSTEALYTSRVSSILTLLRLRSVISSGGPLPSVPDFDDAEASALFNACDTLVGEESDTKQAMVSGLLTGQGEINNVTYARLLDVAHLFLAAHQEPTPLPEPEPEPEAEAECEPEVVTTSVPDVPVSGVPGSLSLSGSFSFVQASELETSEANAEWVNNDNNKMDTPELNGVYEPKHNGVISPPEVEVISTQPIDWAEAHEDGLPSIANLQASLVSSDTPTPEVNLPTPAAAGEIEIPKTTPSNEDDGFTPASRGSRGRGRGHRGDRGGVRGGFRGERGGFHRGIRGSARGGDRAYRGRSDGEGRGGDENRGRGRGRGRRGERVAHVQPDGQGSPLS
ncbi:hypothetical protein EDD17DRAFT_1642568 [Pisolithus thermaeus]|nr:hypothetical protein EV401DRAFT_1905393 [Pisolithus croceorrhizus]KAI6150003.1 hypothetical protein EDD17DRAFT_1642568 [Pisolithus thermaeus]